ncbi:RNA polymerase sigma-28 factor [Candidatus Hydrogenisulfobacillus filiaventi]|uniref:RNA polymerase sigma factor n=1 Tax=Candidatus Hydrogenisulfobacillus filiaventi TaxID=2707344 RepID=A0A6F8ZGN0_9FIRM|nr:RNA polymerase sporulation sigma factor SigK [Bacillota bacterium]CAB1128944.1 RNA polymerase sigma-28 factor [Candidatus Hydrogenisulfobacillus filiaventi]
MSLTVLTLVASAAAALLQGLVWLAGYVGGNAFPHPLSEAEEREALERMAAGDREARALLIERNLRLVAHVVKKYTHSVEEPDDLISIGTVGLIKAVDTFRTDKGVRLATYAARCIENEILMFLRAQRKTAREVSLYEPIGVDREGNEISLLDVLKSDADSIADQVESEMLVEWLKGYLSGLTEKERLVLDRRFGLSGHPRQTQRDIARELGISRSYVSRIEKRAVTRILKNIRNDHQEAATRA